MDREKYVGYEPKDDTYYGAKGVVENEREYIRQRRGTDTKTEINDLSGLALSGGGIRSASFSLGIMQALAHKGWLEKIDYLSTVSGGGYAGSSVSWLLSKHSYLPPTEPDSDNPAIKPFGVSSDNFPYGTYPISAAFPNSQLPPKNAGGDKPDLADHQHRGKLLRYLRQQATYLTPGDGITALSLVAIILRGALMSLFVYFGLLVLAFVLIHPLLSLSLTDYKIDCPLASFNLVLLLAISGGALFVALAALYSVGTYFWSRPQDSSREQSRTDAKPGSSYSKRQLYERYAGRLVTTILVLLILGAVPGVYENLQQMLASSGSTASDFAVNGTRSNDGSMQFTGSITAPVETTDEPSHLTALIGVFSTLFGALTGVMAFFKSSSGKKGRLPMGLVVAVGTAALWFGLLLIAYFIAGWAWSTYSGDALIGRWALAALAIAAIGRWANINYLSIHRYYRDRLMESFMPDVEKALAGDIATRAVTRADKTSIHTMLDKDKETGVKANPAPYHLINTNVVLESSNIPKFRGRGGDNFILSPYYCGSNATGWSSSDSFMSGRMTLPTAMAISGAAVNPSTGVGGQGVTRQPLLSMFMGLLNIRLGYWAPNPNPDPKSKVAAETDLKAKTKIKAKVEAKAKKRNKSIPNFFHPGLCEMFLRSQLNEEADYVQLTDGGHFENLALYELIRRRAKLIIVCDGGADPDFQFTDFANAQEKIRTDFGTLIHCNCHDLQALVPHTKSRGSSPNDDVIKYAKQGYLMRTISYPDSSQGSMLYIKTTFFEKLSADLYGYKKTHPQFPDESTSDQFFDEMQFEAYRELGFQTAWAMMQDKGVLKDPCVKAFIDRKVS